MSTAALERKKKVNRVYADVFIKRRYSDGSYEADWLDITRHVVTSGLNTISYKLDSDDFDVGIFTVSNIRMTFDNSRGKFNDLSDSRSLWTAFGTRHLTKVKVEAGYVDTADAKIVENAFEGIIDERTLSYDPSGDQVQVTALSRDSVFSTVNVLGGTLVSAVTVKAAIVALCARGEITDHITILEANVNPGNNITLDDPTVFDGKKLDIVLNELLLISNSVLYVDQSGYLIVRSRAHRIWVQTLLYANPESGDSCNIYRVSDVNSGRHRVKNAWYWSGTTLSATSSDAHLERFGVTRKTISSDAVTTTGTRQAILDAMRDEWQFPKMELVVETDYMGNDVALLDTVRLNIKPAYSRSTDMPACGSAVAGTDVCVEYLNGLKVEDIVAFKVLGIEHDIRQFKTSLKLREIGTQLNDGYIPMVLSKTFDVTFTAESTKDVDTAAYGINAQRAKVEVLDTGDDYVTLDLEVRRPTTGIVRLVTGVAITKTIRVLVIEVEA